MCASSVIQGTTLGATRRIRSISGAATGQLARQRPAQPVALTESEAIRLAQAGNAAAFEFLYQLHGRRVYALCLRMVGNPADAEDLMQEAFLQLFRKIGTFRGESAFSTWLHRMTVNVVLMRLRKKSLPTDSLEETLEPDGENSGPKRDVGAPDLRLSGAVDRVNSAPLRSYLQAIGPCSFSTTCRATNTTRLRTSWDARSEIRSRSCTKRARAFASCSRRKSASRLARNARPQKLRQVPWIRLE